MPDASILLIVLSILNLVTTVAVMLLGFTLNSMREGMKAMSADLKLLNDAVLGKYLTLERFDELWRETRRQHHDLADKVHTHEVELAVIRAKKGIE